MVKNNLPDTYRPATAAIRTGVERSLHGEHSEALYLTSSFVFDSAQQAAERFSGAVQGNVYARYTNPTVSGFEQRLAALEGTDAAVGTASGMAAILSTCMALLSAGDHVVVSRQVFGASLSLFNKYLTRFGIAVTLVDLTDLAQWAAAIRPETRLFFLETPSNPLNEVADLTALADLAHAHGAWLAVDNCFCTPVLQQPARFGADLVIHSATKFIDGQGRALGGAVCGPDELIQPVLGFLRTAGPSMSPFNAWVFLKGLETLRVRMAAHCANARQLAAWLLTQPAVEAVHYCGLETHPDHELACRQQSDFGAVLSFVVKGGQPAAWRVIDSTRMLSITANLGDTKTTITHPGTTTHGRISAAEKEQAGIVPGLLRLSVGLEDLSDIQDDLLRGLS